MEGGNRCGDDPSIGFLTWTSSLLISFGAARGGVEQGLNDTMTKPAESISPKMTSGKSGFSAHASGHAGHLTRCMVVDSLDHLQLALHAFFLGHRAEKLPSLRVPHIQRGCAAQPIEALGLFGK
mmetsp:Transcript_11574/g.29467  ORF Transcript_11574/g.29467 Transcript_11574/m.29467 type:complete len:124 (+) Transcript_11574:110-481(+)